MKTIIRKVDNRLSAYGIGEFKKYYKTFHSPGNYWIMKIKWLYMMLFEHRGGVSAEDYFIYHLYEKTRSERSGFVSYGKSVKLNKLINKNCRRELVEDKGIFIQEFKNFMKREAVVSNGLTLKSFIEFYDAQKRVICKPSGGCNGNGIFVIEKGAEDNQLKDYYKIIAKDNYVIEGVLEQDGILKQLNPKTLNTIRVNVLNNHGDMKIVNAILRSGQGNKVVDNICAGGCVAEIDVNSGRVITKFCDLSNHIYDVHPLSKVKLEGTIIPGWDKVKQVVFEATKQLPGAGYISWDIAIIKNDEVAIVEGNTWGNFNIQQVPRQIGLWNVYRSFLDQFMENEKR